MKTLTLLFSLALCVNLLAQQENNSLQASLNKALANNDESKILNFEANVDLSQNAIQLKWESTPETNANSFVIEKSGDKLVWKEIATIYGASHNARTTEFLHLDFQPTENISYYRLKSKNDENKESFSNIVPVNYLNKEGATAGMNLHPNFSEDYKIVNIAFEEIFEKEILIVIRDKKGNEFYSKVIINIENESLIAVPIEKEIPSGDYLITATSENQIYSQNITIL
ncbi:MAG: hypothetical protein COA97_05515 [Flavobacteriales bacterium]|nr:MAG: hypothetical protein COA97_05515 [Flavobacteriales bacterium]